MWDKKIMPIGLDDFKTLIEKDCFYFDKTMLIDYLEKNSVGVTLFTRPRRFGKTLNMSMLKYFYDVKKSEENRKLFNGLKIENSQVIAKQGKHPVIYLTFKDYKDSTWNGMNYSIKSTFFYFLDGQLNLRENLNEENKELFDKIYKREATIEEYKDLIFNLSKWLYDYYGEKVVILIDEYDTPLISAYLNGYYKEAIEFFRTLYSSALKGNIYLEKAVLTGILRVAKENMFSGLNNLKVLTIAEKEGREYFGLTEEEVKEGMEYAKVSHSLEEVKKYYDGYNFGGLEIYNPWSIVNYLSNSELRAYWVNTGGIDLITNNIKKNMKYVRDDLERIYSGGEIIAELKGEIGFNNVNDITQLWLLMYYGGYLTSKEDLGDNLLSLRIVNKEIKDFFRETFMGAFLSNASGNFKLMERSLAKSDMAGFKKYLEIIFLSNVSFFDVSNNEKFYHMFILGMFVAMDNRYLVTSNLESGKGRYDVSLEPRDKKDTGYIFEFKVAKSVEELEEKSEEALSQIKDNEYFTRMVDVGVEKITKVGISFCKKDISVRWE